MESLKTGEFFGQTNDTSFLDGVTLTDTEYTHEKVDWHYHENAYFTLILEGRITESNKKETYHCPAGTLLFHNWQEAHYNTKPKGFTRGFHVEIEPKWLNALEVDLSVLRGSSNVCNPLIKIQIYNILKEFKVNDETSKISIQSLLIELLCSMSRNEVKQQNKMPQWVDTLKQILHDTLADNWTLNSLAHALNIHPVHLSRDFSKYFATNLGDYIRTIKIQKALSLLTNKNLSLTDIAYDCGFADQSHFTRCFKAVNQLNPSYFRNILLK
jgi:AraC-like DNA-binding protein